MTTEDLRRRIRARLEEDGSGAVELYEVGPSDLEGRRRVSFYRHVGGESRRWTTTVRIGPDDEVTECEAPSLDPEVRSRGGKPAPSSAGSRGSAGI
ncbi:MAG: hypothetical protein ABSB90_09755 [Thermoplasmata archaeon]